MVSAFQYFQFLVEPIPRSIAWEMEPVMCLKLMTKGSLMQFSSFDSQLTLLFHKYTNAVPYYPHAFLL